MTDGRDLPFLTDRDRDDELSSIGVGAVAVLLCPVGLVLHLRDDDPAISNPGRWSLFGGATDPGESSLQTIERELDEELSIRADAIRGLWRVVDREGDGRLLSVFEATTTTVPIEMVLAEGQALGAFSRSEALSLDLAPLARRVLEATAVDGRSDGGSVEDV
jgi:8-oxo-dGTP diphosphatase